MAFAAMGTTAHITVTAGPAGLAERLERRVHDLEARWSRFRPDSEISRLNENPGIGAPVSPDTVELISKACAGSAATSGAYNPLVLPALVAAGYDRSFADITPGGSAAPPPPTGDCDNIDIDCDNIDIDCDNIDIDCNNIDIDCDNIDIVGNNIDIDCNNIDIVGDWACLPAGAGFDPGGIGKGLAADIVAREAMAEGAAGVLVNIGGDLRAAGRPDHGDCWTVEITEPALAAEPLARLALTEGAVATSTDRRRRWQRGGIDQHHLIDPATGRSATSDRALVTVVAAEAWWAEVASKALFVRGPEALTDAVAALIVDDRLGVTELGEIERYRR